MNVEKLKRLQAQVRIGGKGTPRRKKKVTHQTAAADDKKLQSSLKKLSVSTIPGIEEVNIIKDDLTVIHFNNPKAQASLSANTFAVTGHGETKKVVEMLPEILPHLGQETVVQLRLFANSMTNNQKIDESREEEFKSTLFSTDDNDVPMLVSNFDEIAKSEDLTKEKLEQKSDKILSLEDNALKSNVAQDTKLNIINSNDRKKVLTLNSDDNIKANSIITPKDFKYNNEIVLLTESDQNKDQSYQKDDSYDSDVKSDKKDIQFQKTYTKSSFKEKKNATKPVGEKKDKGTKKASDLKKTKEAHQENKSNIIDLKEYVPHKNADENNLSKLKQTNSVAMRSEMYLQDQDNTKKTVKELKEVALICDDIAHIAVNSNENKQLNIIVNLDAKKNAETKSTTLKNEIHNNYEKLSPDASICLEFNKTENNDSMNSIKPIIKELKTNVDLTTKEIESRKLEEKNQSIKIKPLDSKEIIAKERNPNDAGKEKEKLTQKSAPCCGLLKMDEFDLNPKNMVEKNLPLNQILEQSSIMTHLQPRSVFDMNKSTTTDLLLNTEEKTDSPIINKSINNEIQDIETLQKPLEQAVSKFFPQVTKTDGEQTKESINEDKIQTEILQKPPKDATPSLTTVLNVTKTSDEKTKGIANENKIRSEVFEPNSKVSYGINKNETMPDDIQENVNNYELMKTQSLSAESPMKIKTEQKSQQTCGLESSIAIAQNMEKSINLDECSVTEERKNNTKADEIQENENNKIVTAQNLSAEVHVVTEIEEKLQEISDLTNSETLDQHKEKNNLTECSITEECTPDTNQDTVRALVPTVMLTEKISSEKKIEKNATSPKAVKQPAPKRNETKPGTSAKNTMHSKNAGIGVKTKQVSPPKIQTDMRFISKTQGLPKTGPVPSVKPEKQEAPRKTKQQQTVLLKVQKTTEIKAGSLTQPPIKQNISLLTKALTEISTKPTTAGCLENVPTDQIVDQTQSTLEKPAKSLSSAETFSKKGSTETAINIPIKTDQTSVTTEAIQKQQKIKENQIKSTDISTKTATIEAALAEPTRQLVDQTLSTAGSQKNTLSSVDMAKTISKNKVIETTDKVPNKTRDQTQATTGINQKQPKPKVKQVKSLFGKPESTSKTSQPKSKSSKPAVDLNKNTS